ncbi:MAG TPA: hypothetical protein VL283_02465 [Candidatus Baltobacteraceae bacterium]|nr:hypothetical protein [Candidatus Baltobacteraceae bacterium]
MQTPYDLLDPMFLATRETFPGEKTFHELARGFFAHEDAAARSSRIADGWGGGGVLVHMANPEQIDDLFAHIARQTRVRYLSTTYLQKDIRNAVYAIGRGTGVLLDPALVRVEHVSVNDCDSETDHLGRLEARDEQRVVGLAELHAALLAHPRDDWNEVNASFEGPSPILGFFALDGAMSKLYATALWIKAGGLLPVFTYNRGRNLLAAFTPTPEAVREFAELTTSPHLREKYRSLAPICEGLNIPTDVG